MNQQIDKIVINAIEDLCDDFPQTVSKVAASDIFITRVVYEKKYTTIIDFTQGRILDYHNFIEYSNQLFNEFAGIDHWHEVLENRKA